MPVFAALFPASEGAEQVGAFLWHPIPRTADLHYIPLVVAAGTVPRRFGSRQLQGRRPSPPAGPRSALSGCDRVLCHVE
jgi:hypothetical protein